LKKEGVYVWHDVDNGHGEKKVEELERKKKKIPGMSAPSHGKQGLASWLDAIKAALSERK
jgi:hypothetical protein